MTSPLANLPGWDIAERMVRADDFDDMLRAAFKLQPHARRFLEPRETGKPPVDPDAGAHVSAWRQYRDDIHCRRIFLENLQ